MSPQNVIMGGDSAGGNLVGALLMLIRQMRLEKEFKIMHGTNTNTDSKTHTSNKKTKTKTGRPVLFHSLILLYLISSDHPSCSFPHRHPGGCFRTYGG